MLVRVRRGSGCFVGGVVMRMVVGMVVTMRLVVRMSVFVSMLRGVALPLFPENFGRQVFLAMRVNINFGRRNRSPGDAGDFDCCADVQGRDRLLEQIWRHSRIYQCAEEHVAADAGETIEVSNTHLLGLVFWLVFRMQGSYFRRLQQSVGKPIRLLSLHCRRGNAIRRSAARRPAIFLMPSVARFSEAGKTSAQRLPDAACRRRGPRPDSSWQRSARARRHSWRDPLLSQSPQVLHSP